MNAYYLEIFSTFTIFIILLVIAGIYCILVTRNLIRTLIGLEIITKGVTLLIILAGYITEREGLAQAMAITLIIIEVVILAVAAGIALGVFRNNGSLDTRNLRNLKG